MELLKRPSAFVPLAISTGFLAFFAVAYAQGTLVRQPDEGTGAHLFQLLMPVQLLIMLVFALNWVPKKPRAAVPILALQVAAALGVFAVVYFRHL
jgi:hypothetical protein